MGENSKIELVNCNAICDQISPLVICDALVSHFQILCVHLIRMRKFDYTVLSCYKTDCVVSSVLCSDYKTYTSRTHFTTFLLIFSEL